MPEKSDMKKMLSEVEFRNREYMITHLSYDREMEFYQSVKMGNVEETMKLFKPLSSEGLGKLSEDSLRNLKYHLVITIAFITRYCIEGGLNMEEAYNLSDIYIQRVDKCTSQEEVHSIHREVVETYVQRMNKLHRSGVLSRSVITCIDYIYDNLHSRITLDDLADITGLSAPYLSKLFHRETGVTVKQYILRKKVEAAENLLKFSDYPCSAISQYLGFGTESHFISVFKSFTKITPKEYRERFFRTRKGDRGSWGESE
ncbi:MAG: helix-turn-helix domain-containing protein [Ruminiclostridium sp.]|nr:helix-turn-helix domain-containing protein [Ruminiclostridium sp.]